jgi:hypothetical protein
MAFEFKLSTDEIREKCSVSIILTKIYQKSEAKGRFALLDI